jgi:hypothetical protein
VLLVLRWFVGDHEDVLTGGRLAVPAGGEVEEASADDDGRVVWDSSSLPSKAQRTSVLYQSKSGPTPPLSSAT